MTQDVRFAVRLFLKSPGFFVVAVLTLALGIGANTAIFSVVHALLLRPLPYPEPDRLVMVWQDYSARSGPSEEWATPGNYVDWRGAKHLFANVSAMQGWQPTLTGLGEPEPLGGEQVTPEYFDVLGVGAALGRTFRDDDGVPNAPRVAILSDALWKRRFGGDPRIVGQRVMLGGLPHEIVGVMPSDFRPAVLSQAEIWRPRQLNTATPSRGAVILRVVARLQPELTQEQAQTAATVLAKQLEQAYPESNAKTGIKIVSLHDQIVGDIRLGLLVLLGAVGFVLLIACVNIANLLLARASARGREIAVRLALGAERRRVVRQLLTESLLLAGAGGALGILFGVWGVAALIAIAPAGAPRVNEISLNWPVLLFSAALALATGILFGLVPALQASRSGFTPALRAGGRGTPGPGSSGARRALIVVEVAVALVLLVGSGLLMRTFFRLQENDLGFNADRVLVGAIVTPQAKYPNDEALVAFYNRLLERLSALPGIQKAALSSVIPLDGDSDMDLVIEGRAPATNIVDATTTWYRLVSADYLDAMGIAVTSGRAIHAKDVAPVVVINETGARRFWPGESALGKRLRFGQSPDNPWFTVVGVARDVKMRGARGESRTETYIPYWQFTEGGMNVVLKTAGDPSLLVSALRQAVREIDPDMPVSGAEPMSAMVTRSIAQPRFFALIVGVFAGLALTLAAIGIYGVMSYAVAQRTAEIGVRMALGAGTGDVFRLVVADGLRLAAIGAGIGLAASAALSRSIATLLFEVEPQDPVTFGAMTAALLAVAAVAGFIPARRAARVDPVVALRAE